mmetsp:Transcript_13996/g.30481  ORF Transcript_13996/g.30481 Transcript_13996/m.30481 type:complete len:104 (-) Transcript_13996:98-409(-)
MLDVFVLLDDGLGARGGGSDGKSTNKGSEQRHPSWLLLELIDWLGGRSKEFYGIVSLQSPIVCRAGEKEMKAMPADASTHPRPLRKIIPFLPNPRKIGHGGRG